MENKKQKISRNDPCPCGSGKKYKKCCLDKQSHSQLGIKPVFNLHHKSPNRLALEEKYGHVRPFIHGDHMGQKIIAVGSRLHFSEKWKTVTDFLIDFLKQSFGKHWWLEEVKRIPEQQHPLIRWYFQMYEYLKANQEIINGLYTMKPNGPTTAYMSLAYDLYVLQHHQLLQKQFLKRLKLHDQFQGARYELFTTATFIRAGFDIKFENERDGTSRHPEFIATHKKTGLRYDVEAKKRHRGMVNLATIDMKDFKLGITGLLLDAFGKFRGNPFVIMLDLDAPALQENPFEQPWFKEICDSLDHSGARNQDSQDKFNLLVFTNFPVNYSPNSSPGFTSFEVIALNPAIPVIDSTPINDIRSAVPKAVNIPSLFEELDQVNSYIMA